MINISERDDVFIIRKLRIMKMLRTFIVACMAVMSVTTSFAETDSPMIEVNGSATLSIVPDRITVEVGIEEYFAPAAAGDSAKVSIRSIEKQIRDALANAGVADSMITVSDVGNYADRRSSMKFLMAKRLSAVLTDMAQLDEIMASLPDMGVTSFVIAGLDNSDMARYNSEGLKAAVDAAKKKANAIAQDVGLSNLLVWRVVETSPGYDSMPAFSNASYMRGDGMAGMGRIQRKYSVKVSFLGHYGK